MTNPNPLFDGLFNEDKTKVKLFLKTSQQEFDAEEIENAIRWLGAVRSLMKPAVPIDPSPDATFVEADFCNFASNESGQVPALGGGHILLRSSLFGWVRFVASPELLRGFADWVQGVNKNDAPPKNALN